MDRRHLLATTGTLTGGFLAGCLDPLHLGSKSPPRLGWAALSNYSHDSQRFHVRIHREETLVHDSIHTLPGKTGSTIPGTVLDCTWDGDPGPYTLRARLLTRDWVSQQITTDTVPETPTCVTVDVVYDPIVRADELIFDIHPGCDRVSEYRGGCTAVQ